MPSGGVPNTALLDLLATTLENLPDMEFEVMLEYQRWPVLNLWFKNWRRKVEGGTGIKRNVMLDTTGNAQHVRPYQKTPINVADVQQQIDAPWVQAQTFWSMQRNEMLRNRGKAKFIPLVKSRRLDGQLDMAELLERSAWAAPQNATDDLNPRGLPYWLSKSEAAITTEGFQAYRVRYGDATTSTTKAGIDGSTAANAKWRNYAYTYTGINAAFILSTRKAFHACSFESPLTVDDLKSGASATNYRIYMALDELSAYEAVATAANDNIGKDMDPFHGRTSFRGVPIVYTPQIDDDADDVIYAVNHSHFYPMCEQDNWLVEDGPHTDVEQHNVFTTFEDCSYQYFCDNVREAGFVCHKVTS